MNVTLDLYRVGDGWRWRALGDNHEIIASGEAYTRKVDAVNALRLLLGARRFASLLAGGRVNGMLRV